MDNIQWKVDALNEGITDLVEKAHDFSHDMQNLSLGGIRDKLTDEIMGIGG